MFAFYLKQVMSGSDRMLPASFLAQWERHIGCRKHVGIELEMPYTEKFGRDNTLYVDEFLPIFTELYFNLGIRKEYWVKRSHEHEINVLFPAHDVRSFLYHVKLFVEICRRLYVPTTGSVHINVQMLRTARPKFFHNADVYDSRTDSWYSGDSTNLTIIRSECKCGPSFLSYEELVCNILVATTSLGNNKGSYNLARAKALASDLDPIVRGKKHLLLPTKYKEVLTAYISSHF